MNKRNGKPNLIFSMAEVKLIIRIILPLDIDNIHIQIQVMFR
jgi:hypothetical protein